MVKIIKGKYKNINLRVLENGDIIVKAPKNLSNNSIKNFIESKTKWINKQLEKINEIKNLKSHYNFEIYVYLFNQPYKCNETKSLFYKRAFKDKIIPLLEDLSKRYNLFYNTIKITNSKRIWGSLNSNKDMKLNWKISILPKDLVIYIITHELCHIKEFNHSKKFWDLVYKYINDYKIKQNLLKKYGFLLKENIL